MSAVQSASLERELADMLVEVLHLEMAAGEIDPEAPRIEQLRHQCTAYNGSERCSVTTWNHHRKPVSLQWICRTLYYFRINGSNQL